MPSSDNFNFEGGWQAKKKKWASKPQKVSRGDSSQNQLAKVRMKETSWLPVATAAPSRPNVPAGVTLWLRPCKHALRPSSCGASR